MDAVLSGQVRALALIQGNDCLLLRADGESKPERVTVSALKYIFSGIADVIYCRGITRRNAEALLRTETQHDEALRMLLVLLDGGEETEVRAEAAFELETLLENEGIHSRLRNNLLSSPLPERADLAACMEVISGLSKSERLIRQVADVQAESESVRAAWDAIPDSLFESPTWRQRFFEKAVAQGGFASLVAALHSGQPSLNAAKFDLLSKLQKLENFRAVITAWLAALPASFSGLSKRASHEYQVLKSEDASHELVAKTTSKGRQLSPHLAFQSVIAQQEVITQRLQLADVDNARRFLEQLVNQQIVSGPPEFAAKTLCKMAQEANAVGQYSLQLEWAQRAVELCPEDPMTHGHLADALIESGRLTEALSILERIESFQRVEYLRFVATNRARILRLQGDLELALRAYRDVRTKYGSESGNEFAWNGVAEVLREMSRFDEALEAYEASAATYPSSTVARCGLAAMKAELGQLADAEREYESVLRGSSRDLYALTGKAHLLVLKGEYERALSTYDEVVSLYPALPIGFSGKANVLRLLHRFDEAQEILRVATQRFPFDPSLVGIAAELLRAKGDLNGAIEIYSAANAHFPSERRIANGLANAIKERGDYQEALRQYEVNSSQFPYDLNSRFARADLLKRLGNVAAAHLAYDEIIDKWPRLLAPRIAKAGVLAAEGRYSEADALLPLSEPRTNEEWMAQHVRGMILLKRGDIAAAIEIFSRALEVVPFYGQRRYFQNGLAIALLKKQRFGDVPKLVKDSSEPISGILYMHALAATGDRRAATPLARELISNKLAPVSELSDEIAKRFSLISGQPAHDETWIFSRECEVALLS